jgi:hypothetical protein
VNAMGIFMGKKPEFGQRISLENLKPGDRERFCDEQLIYLYEKKLIEENLRDEIELWVRDYFAKLSDNKIKEDIRNLIETFKKENKLLTVEDILNSLKQKYFTEFEEIEKGKRGEIFRKIENYTKLDKDTKEKLEIKKKIYTIEEASELCRINTSFWKRNFWLFLFIIGAVAELIVLLVQAVLGGEGFNPIILVLAGFLAGGSFMFGYGLGKFIIVKKYKQAGVYQEKEKLLDYLMLICGLLVIFVIAIFRSGLFLAEEFYFGVFIITIILGIIVGLFECKNMLLKEGIKDAIEILFLKQRDYATEEHIKDMRILNNLYTDIKKEKFNSKFSEYVEHYKDLIKLNIEKIDIKSY